jgi:Na+/H+-translocating membrane pyrophosphatase
LSREYLYLAIFSAIFAFIIGATVDAQEMSAKDGAVTNFPYTATAYLIGSGTSILAGYIGMRIAVYTNTRTTYQCCINEHDGFMAAFRGGQVLGFTLVGLALLILHLIMVVFKLTWLDGALQTLFDAGAC